MFLKVSLWFYTLNPLKLYIWLHNFTKLYPCTEKKIKNKYYGIKKKNSSNNFFLFIIEEQDGFVAKNTSSNWEVLYSILVPHLSTGYCSTNQIISFKNIYLLQYSLSVQVGQWLNSVLLNFSIMLHLPSTAHAHTQNTSLHTFCSTTLCSPSFYIGSKLTLQTLVYHFLMVPGEIESFE